MKKITLYLLAFCFAPLAIAGTNHEHPAPKLSETFKNMKALVGTWQGKTNMDGKEQELKVVYELTSNGTALVEKMNPGTPMEMITIYANRGNEIHATHYCALGNQPEMALKKSSTNSFAFEMTGTKGISNKNEMHMRGVTLTLDGDTLKQEWTHYKNNKKDGTVSFELKKAI